MVGNGVHSNSLLFSNNRQLNAGIDQSESSIHQSCLIMYDYNPNPRQDAKREKEMVMGSGREI